MTLLIFISVDPLVELSTAERDLLWNYRHWYENQSSKALAKLVMSVPWQSPRDTYEAHEYVFDSDGFLFFVVQSIIIYSQQLPIA